MKNFLAIFLLFLVLSGCEKKQEKAAHERAARTAPVQSVYPKIDTKDYLKILEENKGKVVLINFFATWCPPCRKEVPELVSLYSSYKDKGVVFLGISVDENGDEAVRPFAEKASINYKVYLSTPDLSNSQQIDSIPHSFLFDKNGKLVQSLKGYVSGSDLSRMINMLM